MLTERTLRLSCVNNTDALGKWMGRTVSIVCRILDTHLIRVPVLYF